MTASWPKTLRTIILASLIGGGAGVASSALTSVYLGEYAAQLEAISGPVSLSEERPRPTPTEFAEVIEAVRGVGFGSFAEIHLSTGGAYGARVSENAVGSGVVLTSDGWILSSPSLFSASDAAFASVVIGESAYPVASVVKDTKTNALFLKIDAANLPVTGFGESAELLPGDPLFVIPARGSLRVTTLVSREPVGPLVSAAEVPIRRLALDLEVPAVQSGAMVLNASGELVGILEDTTPATPSALALPFEALRPAIESLLREGKISRPYLGASVLDLSRAVGIREDISRGFARGARIESVTVGSPSAIAGLKIGDIIIALNDELITSERSLDELVAERAPGDIVAFTIDRGGVEQKIEVTLGSL